MTHKSSRTLILVLICLIAIMGGTIAYAFTSTTPQYTNPSGSTNPDDSTNYITATNSNGMITISNKVDTGEDTIWIGTKRILDGYMYVYGYHYNSTTSPNRDNLSGWKLQESDLGWGCVALSKSSSSYNDPAGVIEGHKVTWMTYAYYGCTKLTTNANNQWALPRIPATVKHTDYMFGKCTGLQRANLTTAHVLSGNTFNGCSALKQIYLGQNVQTIRADAFKKVASGCKLYLDVTRKQSGFATGWNNGISTTKYDADVLIWATIDNY